MHHSRRWTRTLQIWCMPNMWVKFLIFVCIGSVMYISMCCGCLFCSYYLCICFHQFAIMQLFCTFASIMYVWCLLLLRSCVLIMYIFLVLSTSINIHMIVKITIFFATLTTCTDFCICKNVTTISIIATVATVKTTIFFIFTDLSWCVVNCADRSTSCCCFCSLTFLVLINHCLYFVKCC